MLVGVEGAIPPSWLYDRHTPPRGFWDRVEEYQLHKPKLFLQSSRVQVMSFIGTAKESTDLEAAGVTVALVQPGNLTKKTSIGKRQACHSSEKEVH